jgi:hypothetical protein
MVRAAIFVGIIIAIAAIIGGIAVFTYSDGTEITSEPEINTETDEPGKVIKLRLGEAVSLGDAP